MAVLTLFVIAVSLELHNFTKSSLNSERVTSVVSSSSELEKLCAKSSRMFFKYVFSPLMSCSDSFFSSSSFPIAELRLSICLLKIAFCSSISVVALRSFRSSDSRPLKRQNF